jgi:hypothetical protein
MILIDERIHLRLFVFKTFFWFGATTFIITALSLMTLDMVGSIGAFSISNTENNVVPSVAF